MHISLDQALGRESSSPSRVGDRLLQIAGGASAAYSLRSLTGNGGNAVRIRRSSDNVEVNVGFDGSGAVSTTSPITNVAEPTSISFSSTWDIVTGTPASSTLSPLTSFRITDAPSGFIVRLPITTAIAAGNSVDVSTYISTLSGSWSYYLGDFGGGIVSNVETITSGTTLPTLTATGTPYAIYLRSNTTTSSFGVSFGWGGTVTRGDTTSTNLGDFISGTDAFVVTWYDQSGSGNDASQDTLSEQPKIADSSSGLITDPNGRTTISFDGSNDDLDLPDVITSINSASSFNVCQNIGYSSGTQIALALSRLSGGNRRWYLPARTANGWYFSYGPDFGSTSVRLVTAADTDEAQHLFSGVAGSSTAKGYFDGVEKVSVSSVDTYLSQTAGGIGSHNGGSNWSGNISEVVIYASDQTSSLSDIHDNIKTYYDIS